MSRIKSITITLFFFVFVFSIKINAQVDIRKEKIYTASTVDRLPCICESNPAFSKEEKKEFCEEKLKEFMLRHLRYPEAARRNGLEGTVFVKFIVDKKGNVIDPILMNDIGTGCGAEALRVVKLMSKWIPGMQANRPVPVRFEIPVRFSLNDERPIATGESASPEEIAKVAGTFLFIMKKLVEKDNDRKKKQKN